VTGSHAAIPRQSREFGPFGVGALSTDGRSSPHPSEKFSTIGRFDDIPQPQSILARIVRRINTAILGVARQI
jgi:hypothetical protein